MMDQDELIAVFVEESIQHLESIEPDLLAMEKDINHIDPEIVNGIFRAVHSIKGASGFFGLQKIGNLSHIMENLLSLLREEKIKASPEFIDALFAGIDSLRAMFDDVGSSEQVDIETEIDQLTILLNPPVSPLDSDTGITGREGTAMAGTGMRDVFTPKDKIVTVKEKAEVGNQPRTFDIPENALDNFLRNGQSLYTITVYMKRDLTDKGKTPLDLINTIVSNGELIESRLDIDTIEGLSDCLANEITFVFAFATILEENLLPLTMDIPEERITAIDVEAHQEKYGPDSIHALLAQPMTQQSPQ